MQSLQERAAKALAEVLRGGAEKGQIEWKVLIYDLQSRDIIAPILKVGALRTLGITLHLLVTTERQPIRDAPAVYLVQPTEENIRLIANDCKENLYSQYYINFSCPITRPLLELLAQELVAIPNVSTIKVRDQFLNFIALEPDFFSLQLAKSYQTLHSPQALVSDQQMEAYIGTIVSGLASVILQLQVLPVVVSVQGGAAQMVAEKVAARLLDLLRERQLEPATSQSRPVLLLCDRNNDIPVCLAHAWHYRSLLHDVLDMRLNRIELKDPDNPSTPKVYELDRTDKFWATNAGELYHVVADRASEELEKYKQAKEQVTATSDDLDVAMKNMTSMMSSAGQMKEQKKLIDMHTKLAFALLKEIKARQLDAYHHTEVALLNKDAYEKPKFEELLTKAGTDLDRLRLFIVYYYAMEELGPEEEKEVARWERKLAAQGVDMGALAYLKNMRSFLRTNLNTGGAQNGPTTLSKTLLGFGANLTDSIKKAKTQLEATFKSKDVVMLSLTRMVDAILQDPASTAGSATAREARKKVTDSLSCHDPKTGTKIDIAQFKFNQAIVFMVGGGNYMEYQNLKDWERFQPRGKSVIYGGTELFSAAEFLEQLRFLGTQ